MQLVAAALKSFELISAPTINFFTAIDLILTFIRTSVQNKAKSQIANYKLI